MLVMPAPVQSKPSSDGSRISPLVVPAIAAATSLAGSFFGNKQSGWNVDKQLFSQASENERNRKYNSYQAELNRQFQRSLINDYRVYNSPKNQAKLFQEAGFHPLASIGNFGSMDAGISSGSQASYNGGISPVSYSPLDISAASRQLAETELIQAQTEKTEAEADKASKDAGLAEAQKFTEDLMRDGKAALQNIEISYRAKLDQEEANKLARSVDRINEEVQALIKQNELTDWQIKLVKKDVLIKGLDYQFKSQTFEDAVNQFSAQSHITQTEARYALCRIQASLLNMQADTNLKYKQAYQASMFGQYIINKRNIDSYFFPEQMKQLQTTTQRMQFDFDIHQDFGYVEGFFDVLGNGIGALTDAINVKSLLFGGRGGTRVGFHTK
ncbi:DNA pilot protein [Microvirus mar57]|uniref:DNA pilot protein n=1 Tax=Microvirus mar57 TaxID=2851193 RepID=A0A8F5XRE1_9VIRU|nr:DNA pilot protein [Microvirus mar57]